MKGVKVIFAHDTEMALASAAALVNTGRGGKELLPDTDALDHFVKDWGWTGGRAHDQAELDAVRRLRPRLEQLWGMAEDDAAGLVNTLLRETSALPQLVKHDQWDYHLHATPPDAPLADRMAVEAAMAFTDVIRSGQLGRAPGVRCGPLREPSRGPVEEPVAAVLQSCLRQPHQRRRLPGTPWGPVRPAVRCCATRRGGRSGPGLVVRNRVRSRPPTATFRDVRPE